MWAHIPLQIEASVPFIVKWKDEPGSVLSSRGVNNESIRTLHQLDYLDQDDDPVQNRTVLELYFTFKRRSEIIHNPGLRSYEVAKAFHFIPSKRTDNQFRGKLKKVVNHFDKLKKAHNTDCRRGVSKYARKLQDLLDKLFIWEINSNISDSLNEPSISSYAGPMRSPVEMYNCTWPRLLDLNQDECRKILRRIEIDAYSTIITAFRAQGDLDKEKKNILQQLQNLLGITSERHRAEVRRATNDEELITIAESMCGPDTHTEWSMEGRRLVPILPRMIPQTAYTITANKVANMQAKKNCKLLPPSITGNRYREIVNLEAILTPINDVQLPTCTPSPVESQDSGQLNFCGGSLSGDDDVEMIPERRLSNSSCSSDHILSQNRPTAIVHSTSINKTHCTSNQLESPSSPSKHMYSINSSSMPTSVPQAQRVILVSNTTSNVTNPTYKSVSTPVMKPKLCSPNYYNITENIISKGINSSVNYNTSLSYSNTISSATNVTPVCCSAIVQSSPYVNSNIGTYKPRVKTITATRPRMPQLPIQHSPNVVYHRNSLSASANQNPQFKAMPKPTIHIKQEGGVKIITQALPNSNKILPKPSTVIGQCSGNLTPNSSSISISSSSGHHGRILNLSGSGTRVLTNSRSSASVVTVSPKTLQLTAIKGASGTTVLTSSGKMGTNTPGKPNVIVVQKTQARRSVGSNSSIHVAKNNNFEKPIIVRQKVDSNDLNKSSLLAELFNAVGMIPEQGNQTSIQASPSSDHSSSQHQKVQIIPQDFSSSNLQQQQMQIDQTASISSQSQVIQIDQRSSNIHHSQTLQPKFLHSVNDQSLHSNVVQDVQQTTQEIVYHCMDESGNPIAYISGDDATSMITETVETSKIQDVNIQQWPEFESGSMPLERTENNCNIRRLNSAPAQISLKLKESPQGNNNNSSDEKLSQLQLESQNYLGIEKQAANLLQKNNNVAGEIHYINLCAGDGNSYENKPVDDSSSIDETNQMTVQIGDNGSVTHITSLGQEVIGELDPATGLFYTNSNNDKSDIPSTGSHVIVSSLSSDETRTENKSTALSQLDFLSNAINQAQIDLDSYQMVENEETVATKVINGNTVSSNPSSRIVTFVNNNQSEVISVSQIDNLETIFQNKPPIKSHGKLYLSKEQFKLLREHSNLYNNQPS